MIIIHVGSSNAKAPPSATPTPTPPTPNTPKATPKNSTGTAETAAYDSAKKDSLQIFSVAVPPASPARKLLAKLEKAAQKLPEHARVAFHEKFLNPLKVTANCMVPEQQRRYPTSFMTMAMEQLKKANIPGTEGISRIISEANKEAITRFVTHIRAGIDQSSFDEGTKSALLLDVNFFGVNTIEKFTIYTASLADKLHNTNYHFSDARKAFILYHTAISESTQFFNKLFKGFSGQS